MRTLGRNELMQSKLIREGDKTVYLRKTISATNTGSNGNPLDPKSGLKIFHGSAEFCI